MLRMESSSTASFIIGWCLWGSAVTAILFVFGGRVNSEYANEWDQVRREKITVQSLKVVSSEQAYSTSQHEPYRRLNLSDETGKIVDWRGGASSIRVGDTFQGYHLSNGRWLIPYFDSTISKWLYVTVLVTTWGIVATVCVAKMRRHFPT
jgi:hypothetical protein